MTLTSISELTHEQQDNLYNETVTVHFYREGSEMGTSTGTVTGFPASGIELDGTVYSNENLEIRVDV